MHQEIDIPFPVHRLIPSRFPPILLFDWAQSQEELEEIAALEGLTNERIQAELGNIYLVAKEDWVGGPGSSPLMSAFTHPGPSRFSDGTYGVYYAADNIGTAIAETKFHRERFLRASNEAPCLIQMREYVARIQKKLINLSHHRYKKYLHPDLETYSISQAFAREIRISSAWGLYYSSVRRKEGKCVAIFRPPALSTPTQGRHFDYAWDGKRIFEVLSKQLDVEH
ncbi:MAG: RES family NAD+ phosphorylase [Candidatus Berkiellales bacterium]